MGKIEKILLGVLTNLKLNNIKLLKYALNLTLI